MSGRKRFYTSLGAGSKLTLPPDYGLERFRPRIGRLRPGSFAGRPPLVLYLFWYLTSRAGYEIYVVRHGGAIVHTSHVLTKNPRFPFMAPSDLEIGPCWTDDGHRGRGIYPAVLTQIRHHHPDKRFWMFCDEENLASRKGIERAGFKLAGTGSKRGGVYRIEEPARR